MTWQYLSKGHRPKDSRRLIVEKEGYGPNWYKQRWLCLQRDDHKCGKCGSKYRISVHHVRKIKLFVDMNTRKLDYIKANDLSNLIVLCESCHKVADMHAKMRGFEYISK